ncbi:MAG: glycosyltransferase family 4 protein [Acidobacteriota bacterium]
MSLSPGRALRIAHITPGAGGMVCGSCLHDNTLAAALEREGHQVALVPIYTPLRTDEEDVSLSRVFYGAVNIYLQQHSRLFRHTPWMLDRLLDRPGLLAWVGRRAGSVDARQLGALTRSMLEGEEGHQAKELEKLVHWLGTGFRPDIVHLSNSLLLGLARRLREATGAPVVCSVQGEDLFVDELPAADRTAVTELLCRRARDVDAFIAPGEAVARRMGARLGVEAERMHRVPLGIRLDGHVGTPRAVAVGAPFTIGYMARICPEKGLHLLVDAFRRLADRGGERRIRLEVAGSIGPRDAAYLEGIRRQLDGWQLASSVVVHGEVDRAAKLALLARADVVSVPATYPEAKGLYVLEALASGTPVVQPEAGAFPEILAGTGGGILYDADRPGALAQALEKMMTDDAERLALARAGHAAVVARFSDTTMARTTVAVYEQILKGYGR